MANFLPKNLRFLRKAADVSQSQLGLKVNKRDTAVSSWERGGSEPGIDDIYELCKIFAVSAHDLLFSDLENVQISQNDPSQKIATDVQGIVQATVQVKGEKGKKGGEQKDYDTLYQSSLNEASKTIEILGIAIRGLEGANARLLQDIEDYKRQIAQLKKNIPEISSELASKQTRTA